MAQLFNEEMLIQLIRKINTAADLEIIRDALKACLSYVDAVVNGEAMLLISDSTGQDYRDMVSQYDQSRHSHHDEAIVYVKLLNRLCASHDLPPVFTGNDADRHEVANFCLEVVSVLFHNRRVKL